MNELNHRTYDSFVKSEPKVVIHFWASWNEIDQQMTQRLMALRETFGESIAFASVDVSQEEHRQICRTAGVINLPALVLYSNGQHFETEMGMGDTEPLLVRLLASPC